MTPIEWKYKPMNFEEGWFPYDHVKKHRAKSPLGTAIIERIKSKVFNQKSDKIVLRRIDKLLED